CEYYFEPLLVSLVMRRRDLNNGEGLQIKHFHSSVLVIRKTITKDSAIILTKYKEIPSSLPKFRLMQDLQKPFPQTSHSTRSPPSEHHLQYKSVPSSSTDHSSPSTHR